jgi:hypothetical protein
VGEFGSYQPYAVKNADRSSEKRPGKGAHPAFNLKAGTPNFFSR